MRFRTIVRTSSATWSAAIVLAISVLYYYATSWQGRSYGWAPTVVSYAELTTVPLAYAVGAGLAVWESGRLRAGAVWQLAPARSRYRIAAQVLAPVIALTWLTHLLVVGVAFVHTGVSPTVGSVRALAISMPLCAAYAVMGFAVGLRMNRYAAAPIFAALVWVVTAMAWSIGTPWPRQMSGVFPRQADFGEIISWRAVVPHLLTAGGIAMGIFLLWWGGPRLLRGGLALIVAVAAPATAYSMVRDWGYQPPMLTRQAKAVCSGDAPRMCVPEVTADALPDIRGQVVSTLADLNGLGVDVHPDTVTDTLLRRGGPKTDDSSVLYVPLTKAHEDHSIRLTVILSSVTFGCPDPAFAPVQAARMWAAQGAGEGSAFTSLLTRQLAMSRDPDAVVQRIAQVVDKVHAKSAGQQQQWYRHTLQLACEKAR